MREGDTLSRNSSWHAYIFTDCVNAGIPPEDCRQSTCTIAWETYDKPTRRNLNVANRQNANGLPLVTQGLEQRVQGFLCSLPSAPISSVQQSSTASEMPAPSLPAQKKGGQRKAAPTSVRKDLPIMQAQELVLADGTKVRAKRVRETRAAQNRIPSMGTPSVP